MVGCDHGLDSLHRVPPICGFEPAARSSMSSRPFVGRGSAPVRSVYVREPDGNLIELANEVDRASDTPAR